MATLIMEGFIGIGRIGVAFAVGWSLALVLMSVAPLIILTTYIISKVIQNGFTKSIAAYTKSGAKAS